MYDYLVFIGRFQPYHKGHHSVVLKALELSRNVIIVLGGANRARSGRNPWTAHERMMMVAANFDKHDRNRIHFIEHPDWMYDDTKWLSELHHSIDQIVPKDASIGIIGHSKDRSSFYLKMFPGWGSVDVPQKVILSATEIRDRMFHENQYTFSPEQLTEETNAYLETWLKTHYDVYHSLINQNKFIKDYKKQWESAPYPPFFQTVDAVVIKAAHVLLVRRRADPGKGLWALPGGFVHIDERLEDAMVRELKEETGIKLPPALLRGKITKSRTFDAPFRSERGRTITQAYLVDLNTLPDIDLPAVKGSDDADKAAWVQLSDLRSDNLFEDHWDIIQTLI